MQMHPNVLCKCVCVSFCIPFFILGSFFGFYSCLFCFCYSTPKVVHKTWLMLVCILLYAVEKEGTHSTQINTIFKTLWKILPFELTWVVGCFSFFLTVVILIRNKCPNCNHFQTIGLRTTYIFPFNLLLFLLFLEYFCRNVR